MSIQLIQQYYANVEKMIRYGGTRNESTLRKPFQDLLEQYARSKNLVLVPEVEYITKTGRRVVPDGTMKDALRQDWGFWESKDEKDTLADEIAAKLAKGYPAFNILFEDTHTAVLYQGGEEVLRADFADATALDALLTLFVGYESPEVRAFHKAIEQFSADVPQLAATLRAVIDEQVKANAGFQSALDEFLELCKKAINPKIEMADVREMVIQHVLTEDIFMRVFDEAEFHRENVIARKLQEVAGTFYHGETKHLIHARIAPYYETINARASQISDHHEKQKFLKALYENFYKAYNPKAADRLGVIYTPDEIVRFMVESADTLTFKHFGKTLGDRGVEILDPATGTGTFITELIEYLPPAQLEYKYEHEIHCNEVAILPYYIANLNIEYTYKQKTGLYKEFENICFVDTLDNTGFTKEHTHQIAMFGLVDKNALRIDRQNARTISVVIGNPPYNANQLNENENNKNREYPNIDKRIKETYIENSTAQKTKLYDMYARFLRWASDRLDKNGVIAFVSNNSFLNARSYDGFRKVVASEFNEIYIIDLKGDARTSGDQRQKEGGNIFSDQIRVGVAVYFFVRKQGLKGCHIRYTAIADYATAAEKQAYLRDNKFTDLKFQPVHPDKNHNWLNLSESDWSDLIPIAAKESKGDKTATGAQSKTIFKLFSLGVVTNRDDWVHDETDENLAQKVKFFVDIYNGEVDKFAGKIGRQNIEKVLDNSIKWTRAVKNDLVKGKRYTFDENNIVDALYRPFVKKKLYFAKELNEMQYQLPRIFPGKNVVIALSGTSASKPFSALATDEIFSLDLIEKTQCLPLYRYSEGERVENITDWALVQFQKHYKDKTITKENIFHYVYAVLHHSAYRSKYEQNLKREFPRIPFYENFWKWAEWGERLMELHLNYETVEAYPLERVESQTSKVERPTPPVTRLMARKDTGIIEVDTVTSLRGVPSAAWEYRLGTYSALEWVLERYKEKKPKDPTIAEKFNIYKFADYKESVIELLGRVCAVSVKTMEIVKEMPE
ncbi:MAG: restriction enzyme and modification methylase [Anaerolineaceae bacterium]|nr:MAG: restriction enzyme and modification methylase [Anaerolineaceae bacterium]